MKPQYPLKATNETGDVTVDIQGFTVPDSSITASSGMVNIATATGDVTGPASATNEAATVFNGTTGKTVKDGAAINVLQKRAVESFTTTATAAGTTTLTVASNPIQEFTGVTTQTVVLPVVTTLPKTGFGFTIINNSTGNLTVNSSGANLVQTVLPGATVFLWCILLTGTTAASWESSPTPPIDSAGSLTALTTTGNITSGNYFISIQGSGLQIPSVGYFEGVAEGTFRIRNWSAAAVTAVFGGGAAVASATALPVPVARVYHVTGNTTITSITSTNCASGIVITLIFDDVLTFTDGSNLKLAGDFVTSVDDTITLAFDGTNWYEVCRSAN